MEKIAETRQSTGKNLADFTLGVVTSLCELPSAAIGALNEDEFDYEKKSAEEPDLLSNESPAFRAGYSAPAFAICTGMAVGIGIIGYEIARNL